MSMPISTLLTLEHVRKLQPGVYDLRFSGDTSGIQNPGEFVNLALPGKFLRRPISVCDWWENGLNLLVKEAGTGTRELVQMSPGTRLDCLIGLGNGFDLFCISQRKDSSVILAGGGIGLAPLYGLAKRMIKSGDTPMIALGFAKKSDLFYQEEFEKLGCPVLIATQDGSFGIPGTVADMIQKQVSENPENKKSCYICACGPLPMLKALWEIPQITDGQFSFEARMACGFGACMGCTIRTKNGPRRVCKDGPVFHKEEISW